MRLHFLQHADQEVSGRVGQWAQAKGFSTALTRPDLGQPLPGHRDYDALVVLGGPMGVNDGLAWLEAEQEHIAKAIALGRHVLGICLGAQLIAAALGAGVSRNPVPEIGFLDIALSPLARSCHLFRGVPAQLRVFQWHQDTFDLPRHAALLASSPACAHQGFLLGEHVLALQFHLETTPEQLDGWLADPGPLPQPGPTVQSPQAMRQLGGELLPGLAQVCDTILNRFFVL